MARNQTKIEINRALRRTATTFGVSRDTLFVLVMIIGFCLALWYSGVPSNIAIAIFVTLFLAALITLRNGSGDISARFRKPRNYTRGCFNYVSPLDRKKS